MHILIHQWAGYFFTCRDQLGLKDKQLDEVESLFNAHTKYAIRKNADRKILVMEIEELLVEKTINHKDVKKKLEALGGLDTEMAMEGIQTLDKALAVLTTEQKEAMRDLFKNSTSVRGMACGMMGTSMTGPCAQGQKGQRTMPGPTETMGTGMMEGGMARPHHTNQ